MSEPIAFRAHAHPYDETTWEGLVELYSQGSCHVLALAAAEIWKDRFSHFQIITNPYEMSWENPSDPDDGIACVVHVYAVLRHGERDVSLDIFGLRDETLACTESGERYSVGFDACEDGYTHYLLHENLIERNDPEDPACGFRPLHQVSERDLEEAEAVLRTLYPSALDLLGSVDTHAA